MFQKEFELYRNQAKEFGIRVKRSMYSEDAEITCEFANSKEPVAFKDRLKLNYKLIRKGEKWGDTWDSGWFRVSITIPKSFAGKEVALLFDAGGESLIFDANGVPVYGLTGGSVFSEDFEKNRYILTKNAKGGENFTLWIEAAANSLFGVYLDPCHTKQEHPYGHFTGTLKYASIAVFERELWNLALDIDVANGLLNSITDTDYRKHRFLRILCDAANAYREEPRNAADARQILQRILSLKAADSAMTTYAVGHAHIDTGWLWPVRETIRKCARTFASQIAMIEQYPDYVFGASAAQHYAFTKEHYPELYQKIKHAVKGGRWEIQGGMWVEADCNLISGESMIRQFLHGKNFFMDEFGFDVKNLWIPDVFGYSASMPQIIRKTNCDSFLTQKISWSQFNKFPYQTFLWKGIDGSEVLTHFPPENTYNSAMRASALVEAQNNFANRDSLSSFMTLFGIGDGGGGPCEEHVEFGLRMKNLEGCPKVKFDRADHFFKETAKETNALPSWRGELYLEFHRGTLTTQAKTKRNNRKLEQLLTTVEFFSSLLPTSLYPAKELDSAWKLLLLNQFHDIIPGSSITKVYETTEKEHASLFALCEKLLNRTAGGLFETSENSAVVLNSLSCDCDTILELPESWNGREILDESGTVLNTQFENGKTVVRILLKKSSLTLLRKGETCIPLQTGCSDDLILENEFVRYEFSPSAELLHAYDKINRKEILKSGAKGNCLALYADYPLNYEAWDIELFYDRQLLEHAHSVKAEKTVCGGIRSILTFELAISTSTIRQTVILEASGMRLDFKTEVEWNEVRKMLRTSFPVNIFSEDASFDIQYGYVKRSMNNNTSWDIAKFEAVGQRYADISCENGGVALLNDCKYGYKVKDGILDLALLRAPKHPDWNADQGHQEFTYSLLPHEGDLTHSDVMNQAALLNRPPMVFDGFTTSRKIPFALDSDSVSLEVVKKAEKEDCLIFRMVETKGKSATAKLRWNGLPGTLVETDLMEWNDGVPVSVGEEGCTLSFSPFEIKTFKMRISR